MTQSHAELSSQEYSCEEAQEGSATQEAATLLEQILVQGSITVSF